MRMTSLRARLGLSAAICAGSASVAFACSLSEPVAFAVDPSLRESDDTPPPPFTGLEATVTRYPGVTCRDGQCTANSCGSSGSARITFDMPPGIAGKIGYRIVWLNGEIPEAAESDLASIWPLGNGNGGKAQVGISIGFD